MKYVLPLLFFMGTIPALATDLPPDEAKGPAANDNLNAVLWDQSAVEAKATMTQAYVLARIRFDEALADKSRTADPSVQTGDFVNKPPAVVLDVDDTVLNTSAYQAWTVTNGTDFSGKTWDAYVKAEKDVPIAGAIPFLNYAARRGVTIFYVTNRTEDQEAPTVEEMKKLGFPMGKGKVDTFLAEHEKPDWGGAKSTRRAYIAKKYRILLLFGDNMGDFTDKYTGSVEDRDKVYEADMAHWGHDWIALPNPTYGSFQSAPFLSDYSKSADEQRKEIEGVLKPWSGPSQ